MSPEQARGESLSTEGAISLRSARSQFELTTGSASSRDRADSRRRKLICDRGASEAERGEARLPAGARGDRDESAREGAGPALRAGTASCSTISRRSCASETIVSRLSLGKRFMRDLFSEQLAREEAASTKEEARGRRSRRRPRAGASTPRALCRAAHLPRDRAAAAARSLAGGPRLWCSSRSPPPRSRPCFDKRPRLSLRGFWCVCRASIRHRVRKVVPSASCSPLASSATAAAQPPPAWVSR